MAIYVDDMKAPYRGMVMCHMTADTREELDDMADKIGVQRKWIQYPGRPNEHYDICMSKRSDAIRYGAIECTIRDTAILCRAKRMASVNHKPQP